MKRMRIAAVVVLLVGTLVGVTATSTMSVQTERNESTLALAIFVNRLELSPEQMRTVRDHLTDVLAAVDAIEQRRASFEDEMIRFRGSSEELDERLLAFREETAAAHDALQETLRSAVDDLKDTLTIRQGEIIARFVHELRSRQAVPAVGFGPLSVERSASPGRVIVSREENGLLALLRGIRGRITALVHEDGEACDELEMPRWFFDPDRMSERMRDRMGSEGPQAAERFMRAQLGWGFPVDSARYWMLGLIDPAAPGEEFFDESGGLTGLAQHGWQLEYDRFEQVDGLTLPTRIRMVNSRARLKVVVARWKLLSDPA